MNGHLFYRAWQWIKCLEQINNNSLINLEKKNHSCPTNILSKIEMRVKMGRGFKLNCRSSLRVLGVIPSCCSVHRDRPMNRSNTHTHTNTRPRYRPLISSLTNTVTDDWLHALVRLKGKVWHWDRVSCVCLCDRERLAKRENARKKPRNSPEKI